MKGEAFCFFRFVIHIYLSTLFMVGREGHWPGLWILSSSLTERADTMLPRLTIKPGGKERMVKKGNSCTHTHTKCTKCTVQSWRAPHCTTHKPERTEGQTGGQGECNIHPYPHFMCVCWGGGTTITTTITIYFIHPSGKLKLLFTRTMKNISQ